MRSAPTANNSLFNNAPHWGAVTPFSLSFGAGFWADGPGTESPPGHSTFSRASAEVLRLMTGSERFYDGVTSTAQDVNSDGELDILGEHIAPAGSSFIAQGPAEDIVLRWHTFREAADEAGESRLFGGIHIQDGDLRGRELGAKVGQRVFDTAQQYFNGSCRQVVFAGSGLALRYAWLTQVDLVDY